MGPRVQQYEGDFQVAVLRVLGPSESPVAEVGTKAPKGGGW